MVTNENYGNLSILMKLDNEPLPSSACQSLRPYIDRPLREMSAQQLPYYWSERQRDLICKYIVNHFISSLSQQLEEGHTAIKIVENDKARTIEVLSTMRFRVEKQSGKVKTYLLTKNGTFRSHENIAIDLPLRLSGVWLETRLFSRMYITSVLREELSDVRDWQFRPVIRRIVAMLRASIYWRRLRHDIRDSLGLNRELLHCLRLGKTRKTRFFVTELEYNRTLPYLAEYLQLRCDAPHLVWILNLLVHGECLENADGTNDEKINNHPSHILRRMKEAFKRVGLGAASWRYVLNAQVADFEHIVYEKDGRASSWSRWIQLCGWLFIMRSLRWDCAPPKQVISLFLRTDWKLNHKENTVIYQSVRVPMNCFGHILNEARQQAINDTFRNFADGDFVDLITWLGHLKKPLDRHQQRLGYTWMLGQARRWKQEELERNTLSQQKWLSGLPTISLGDWRIEPLTSAWQLRRHALDMRNCADTYVAECKENHCRIFALFDGKNKVVATLGYAYEDNDWKSLGAKGFANRPPSIAAQRIEKILLGFSRLFC